MSHAGLFIAVFSLAKIMKALPGGVILSPLVLILGNIFILIFEGVIVSIQGIRLEYYEFFDKFFIEGGKLFTPLKRE